LSQERIFQAVENLDTLLSAIPAARRQRLVVAAQSLGLDTSGLALSMTLREALKDLGNQIQISVAGL
jgi:hypothetical protein